MKIAMIGQKRIPSREGGIEIVVEELAVRMVALGHEVDCYVRDDDPNVTLPTEYKGIRLIRIPTSKKQSLNAFIYSVLGTIRACFGGYDVIHFHAEGPCAMTFLPKIFHIPVVSTIHGLDWQRAKWGGFATRYLLFGEKNATIFSDSVIVLSRAMKDYFFDKYSRETVYLRNGVSIVPHTPPQIITEKWNLTEGSYILFLARIVPEKGLHYLIEAYRNIETDKRLVIAGGLTDTDYVNKIRSMAAEDDRIILADFVTGQLREELMSNCFLYVLPSDVEGMAISLLEALSFGVRCLVSDISENTEASGTYANYFNKSNVEDLRVQLTSILNSRNDFDRAKQINFVTQEYSWDMVVQETLRIYESVQSKPLGFMAALTANREKNRVAQLIANIEVLEARRKRAQATIFQALMENHSVDQEDVAMFNRYTSEIEILREQLQELMGKTGLDYKYLKDKLEDSDIILNLTDKVQANAEQ